MFVIFIVFNVIKDKTVRNFIFNISNKILIVVFNIHQIVLSRN